MTRHLRQKDLAERWHVSPRTLERWRWLGRGPRFLKVGGRVVYAYGAIRPGIFGQPLTFDSTQTL